MERPRYLSALKNVALASLIATNCAPRVEAQAPVPTPTERPPATLATRTESPKPIQSPTATEKNYTTDQRVAMDYARFMTQSMLTWEEVRVDGLNGKLISQRFELVNNELVHYLEWQFTSGASKKVEIVKLEPKIVLEQPLSEADRRNKVTWRGNVGIDLVWRQSIRLQQATFSPWSKYKSATTGYYCEVTESRFDKTECKGTPPSGVNTLSDGLAKMVRDPDTQ